MEVLLVEVLGGIARSQTCSGTRFPKETTRLPVASLTGLVPLVEVLAAFPGATVARDLDILSLRCSRTRFPKETTRLHVASPTGLVPLVEVLAALP